MRKTGVCPWTLRVEGYDADLIAHQQVCPIYVIYVWNFLCVCVCVCFNGMHSI